MSNFWEEMAERASYDTMVLKERIEELDDQVEQLEAKLEARDGECDAKADLIAKLERELDGAKEQASWNRARMEEYKANAERMKEQLQTCNPALSGATEEHHLRKKLAECVEVLKESRLIDTMDNQEIHEWAVRRDKLIGGAE